MPAASKDPAAAPAGTYTLDLEHHAVIARVSHQGVSFNVLRFAVKQGSLVWDATDPAKVKLEVTVNSKPITDPIDYRIKIESETISGFRQVSGSKVCIDSRARDGWQSL